jgi:hypothetical protein
MKDRIEVKPFYTSDTACVWDEYGYREYKVTSKGLKIKKGFIEPKKSAKTFIWQRMPIK